MTPVVFWDSERGKGKKRRKFILYRKGSGAGPEGGGK